MSLWTAKPTVPANSRVILERAVNALPTQWLKPPQDGEVFDSINDGEKRLRGFALAEGFDVVRLRGGTAAFPASEFGCIHHGQETRNYRELEDRVERDEDGNIVSQRRRQNTRVAQLNCPWLVRIAWKNIGKRNSGIKGFVMKTKCLNHSHSLTDNALNYPRQLAQQEEYQQLISTVQSHRIAMISYTDSRRILLHDQTTQLGIHLSKKQYYNSVRNSKPNRDDSTTILGLLQALNDAGFVYRTRVEIISDPLGVEVSRKLIQIFFTHPKLIIATARFVSGFLLSVDGTFNTNRARLPLLIAVGILNSGRTFPVAFSYCPSESEASITFFLDSLKEFAFSPGCGGAPEGVTPIPPAVIIGDHAGGLKAAISKVFSTETTVSQACDWHAVEAMIKNFRNSGRYSVIDIDGTKDKQNPGLKDHAWKYVKAENEETKNHALKHLMARLHSEEQAYMKRQWMPNERRFCYCFTKSNANLGATSSQRSEGYHDKIRPVTNGQLSLKDSATRISDTVLSIITDIDVDEGPSSIKYHRLGQSQIFQQLVTKVTRFALIKIEEEWHRLQRLLVSNPNQDLGDCENCVILHQFGIACKHYLYQIYLTGDPIPRSFLHPRWWLDGPPICVSSWTPTIPTNHSETPSTAPSIAGDNNSLATYEISAIRRELQPEERRRFDAQIAREEAKLINIGRQHLRLQAIPIQQPDPNPRYRVIRHRNNRGMTGAELAARAMTQDLQNQPQATTKSESQGSSPGPGAIRTPSPSSPIALPIRTPGALQRKRPAPIDSPEPLLLSSTAPPKLGANQNNDKMNEGNGNGNGKRIRRKTEKYKEAVARGYLEPSQYAHRDEDSSYTRKTLV